MQLDNRSDPGSTLSPALVGSFERTKDSAESPYQSRNPLGTKQPFDVPLAADCRGKVLYDDGEFRSSPVGFAATPMLRFGRLAPRLLRRSIHSEPLALPLDIFSR